MDWVTLFKSQLFIIVGWANYCYLSTFWVLFMSFKTYQWFLLWQLILLFSYYRLEISRKILELGYFYTVVLSQLDEQFMFYIFVDCTRHTFICSFLITCLTNSLLLLCDSSLLAIKKEFLIYKNFFYQNVWIIYSPKTLSIHLFSNIPNRSRPCFVISSFYHLCLFSL